MSDFNKKITISGVEYTCEYNYLDGNECHLNKVYLDGKQMVGNGLPMPIFLALCEAIHKEHMSNDADMKKSHNEEGDDEYFDIIINLTQHQSTPEQGCLEPKQKSDVQASLTFDDIPSVEEMQKRARFLAAIAKESGATAAMIGGAPFFMSTLERALIEAGVKPVYAFSRRESVESVKDGIVTKLNVFKHVGFVEL